jgi:hypothetical protein
MKRENIMIQITTTFLFLYVAMIIKNFSFNIIFLMFIALNILFLFMVYFILKSTFKTSKTFDTHYYLDADIQPGK